MPNDSRLDAVVHYVCATCDNPAHLGATKLNKILWYSDVAHYANTGSSITAAVYVKRQFGPVPKDIMFVRARLKAAGKIVERPGHLGPFQQTQFIALTAPDISGFTAEEISLVDMVAREICGGHTAVSISHASHDSVWEAAEIGEVIPMSAAAFGSNLAEIDEDDIAWARQEIYSL